MKSNEYWLILLVTGFLLIPLNVLVPDADAAGDWIIDGDTVYIDDENLYISATPHTLDGDGWVEFELETKTFDGDIDIVWGFDIPDCTPHNPQIWKNYTHELVGYHYVDRVGSIEIFNVTGWINLGIENYDLYVVDYGNSNNTFLMNISYVPDEFFMNETNGYMIVAFSSYVEFGDGDDYRLTGHYDNYESYFYYEDFFDWKSWDTSFNIIPYEHGGMNTWYLVGASIVHDYRYRVRAWIDIPFNTVGKYWWAMKPHDKTIPEAIAEGSFYSLDPWWNSDFSYYKMITIESDYIDNDLSNFPVLVVINDTIGDKCNGGNSLNFVDMDNTTEYWHEKEKWVDNEDRIVWVNVTFISSSVDTKFLMYYGNSEATDSQSPTDVWDSDYIAVWHMNDASEKITDSTYSYNSTSVTTSGIYPKYEQTGKIGYCIEFEGDGSGVAGTGFHYNVTGGNPATGVYSGNTNYTQEAWVNTVENDEYQRIFYNYGETLTGMWLYSDGNARYLISPTSNYYVYSNNYPINTWFYLTATYDTTNGVSIYNNSVFQDNDSHTGDFVDRGNGNAIGYDKGIGDEGLDGYLDELRVSSVTRNTSWINTTYNTISNPSTFLSFGSEQSKPSVNAPQINNMYPVNESTENTLFPVLGVTVNDKDGDVMTITWYSNVSGSWVVIGINLSDVYNGTYYQKFVDFTIYGLTYYWNASVTDGTYIADSGVFSFTAEDSPSASGGGVGAILLDSRWIYGFIGGVFGILGFLGLSHKLGLVKRYFK